MTEIVKKNLAALKEGLENKEFSATEVTQAYLDNIKKYNTQINAYVTICEKSALEQAKISDSKIAKGENSVLEGIPLGIKDNFCTKNIRTTACSKMLEKFIPPYESTVTSNLWQDGAVLLGKLNMDQLAMGSANLTSYFGPVINPIKRSTDDKELVPGGSSGGSSAAVRGYLCAGALGSDTGGSIRQPAAFTGLVGMKPTYGRCSRWGVVAFASSLEQAGPITHTVLDNALLLNSMAGYDKKDSTSLQKDKEDFTQDMSLGVKGLKIGIPHGGRLDELNEDITRVWKNAIEALKKMGAEIVDISLDNMKYAAPTYYVIASAEASSNFARFDGVRYGFRTEQKTTSLDDLYIKTRSEGFGEEVKSRIMTGAYVLSSGYYDAYYKKAEKVRRLISDDFIKAFKNVDAILVPSTPNEAFALDEKPDLIEMYYNDIFTVSANLTGIPALSIPAGLSKSNLPLGVQVLAPRLQEKLIYRVANSLEKEIAFDPSKLLFR